MPRIAFIHPNLGIGGAERLIIDLALVCQKEGHSVKIFTNFYSPNHCFKETKEKLTVDSRFQFIPDSIFGAFKVYLAALKAILLTFYFLLFHAFKYELVFVDQISVLAAPFLRLFGLCVIYYCHFPDQLLTERGSFLKIIYRYPIDCLELLSSYFSSKILVNSNFTRNIFLNLSSLILTKFRKNKDLIEIVYPSVDEKLPLFMKSSCAFNKKYVFVSINRYDPKKKIERAIEGLYFLKASIPHEEWDEILLVIMGGCDPFNNDNKYFVSLLRFAEELGLYSSKNHAHDKIKFIKNPTDDYKLGVLKDSIGLIYTPDYEHFGIVPLEAMMMRVPVLASATGGPLETVVHEVTGFHINDFPEDLAKKMKFLIHHPEDRVKMGAAGYERAMNNFSSSIFRKKVNEVIKEVLNKD